MNQPSSRRRSADPRALVKTGAGIYAAALIILSFLMLFCLAPLVDAGHTAHAQNTRAGLDKLDSRLKMLLAGGLAPTKERSALLDAARDEVSILIQGDQEQIGRILEANGGRRITVVGDICTARVPRAALLRVAAESSVGHIEGARPMHATNETAAASVHADKVHAGASPLPASFTGRGVLVGIVDSGIDWEHRDFRDPVDTNLSRIVAIWDQADQEGPSPEGFDYGTLWTGEQITAALRSGNRSAIRHVDSIGHGTHVSGTAAGNGSAIGQHAGMAPEAAIAVVALDWSSTATLVDGADFLFRLGTQLDRPVVINMSLGFQDEARDGTSLIDQALDHLVSERPGRLVCASAGNEGGEDMHWGGTLGGSDSLWTWVVADPAYSSSMDRTLPLVLTGLAETNAESDLEIAIEADSLETSNNRTTLHTVARTEWTSLADIAAANTWTSPLLRPNGATAATVMVSASERSGRETGLTFVVNDVISERPNLSGRLVMGQDLIRIVVRGTGRIHFWKSLAQPVHPAELGLTTDSSFLGWDGRYGISSPGAGRKTLTVGASNNAMVYDGYRGHKVTYGTDVVGQLAPFSSAGPTIDGRMKPDIVAPGHGVISSLSRAFKAELDPRRDESGIAAGGLHVIMSGTSMSSPVVTGAVALYMQRYPTATADQIKEAITSTAYRDDAVLSSGALPNAYWGYGKLDILAAISSGPTSAAPIEQPAADGSMVISPNPASGQATLRLDLAAAGRARVELLDQLGRSVSVVADGPMDAGHRLLPIDVSGLPSSIYMCRVTLDGRQEIHRLVVRH